jgi:putative ABC transport system permease protein
MNRQPLSRYATLARRYLVAQRKRTALTIGAVIMAVALVSSAAIFGESLKRWLVTDVAARHGGFHITYHGASTEQLGQLRQDPRVDLLGTTILVAEVLLMTDLTAYVHAPDRQWMASMSTGLTAGEVPSGPGEIAVEAWSFAAAGRPVAVGDQIEVMLRLTNDNEVSHQFRVVGLLAPSAALFAGGSAMAIISVPDAESLLGSGYEHIVGITIQDGLPLQETLGLLTAGLGPGVEGAQNTALLTALGDGVSDAMNKALGRVELIVTLIVLLATVFVIYNSFAISVIERIRHFGILRTVGATPGQIRRLVFREAGIVALVGAPLGLAAGIGAVRLVVLAFNYFTGGDGFSNVAMSYPVFGLVAGPLVGTIAVLVSAWIPANRAAAVSPLEAVLSEGRSVKDRIRKRPHRILRALFGVVGTMAGQNLRRTPGRLLVTVLSIAIGITLFVTFTGFFQIISSAALNNEFDPLLRDIGIRVSHLSPQTVSTREFDAIARLPNVSAVLATTEVGGHTVLARMPDEWAEADPVDPQTAGTVRQSLGRSGVVVPVAVIGLNEAALDSLRPRVLDGVSTLDWRSDNPGAFVLAGDISIGETVAVLSGGVRAEFIVAGTLTSVPQPTVGDAAIIILTTDTFVAETWPRTWASPGYRALSIELDSPDLSEDTVRAITAVLGGERPEISVVDWAHSRRQERSFQTQLSILLYGLIVVVTLIGVVNIINTITTELVLRVREFGILRAVGMTTRQMRGMVRIEAMLYAANAVVVGSLAGLGLTRMLFRNLYQLQTIPWQFPLRSIGIASLGALVVTFASTVSPMRRIGKMNIVEGIRAHE